MIHAFTLPSTVITGVGASGNVGEEAKRFGATSALIVTDPGVAKIGYPDKIREILHATGLTTTVFAEVTPDPTLQNVQDGVNRYIEEGCDLIVSVGGGSAIDCGKAIAIKLTNTGDIADYAGVNKIPAPGASHIAIPTTGGTGSEVTKVTVITDTQRNVKMMLSSPCLLTHVALIDPILSLTTPPALTAAVGVDALTHAIEAYISKRAQPITDTLAMKAIRMITGSIRQAWADGGNIRARTDMMIGAAIAGMAFSNASVALVHGMSRPIGAYFHIHHGLSNAVLLREVMAFTCIGAPTRFADIARAMGEPIHALAPMHQADAAITAVERLLNDVQIPKLNQIGIDKQKFENVVEQMATDAIASGSPANNPRQATAEEIVTLYRHCFR